MAYNRSGLFGAVCREVAATPRKSLATLAKEIGVSPNTIKKAVRVGAMQTCGGLRRRCLLRAVERMLCTFPQRSIKEIAFNLGFGTPRSLERFVKKSTGLSPSGMRSKQHSQGPAAR
jgi:AraC-like DNA-binding protein